MGQATPQQLHWARIALLQRDQWLRERLVGRVHALVAEAGKETGECTRAHDKVLYAHTVAGVGVFGACVFAWLAARFDVDNIGLTAER